jgi:hypothetical protein
MTATITWITVPQSPGMSTTTGSESGTVYVFTPATPERKPDDPDGVLARIGRN